MKNAFRISEGVCIKVAEKNFKDIPIRIAKGIVKKGSNQIVEEISKEDFRMNSQNNYCESKPEQIGRRNFSKDFQKNCSTNFRRKYR